MGELYNIESERTWNHTLVIKPTLGSPGGGFGPEFIYAMVPAEKGVTVKGVATDLADLALLRTAADEGGSASVTDQHGQAFTGLLRSYSEATSNEDPLIRWSVTLRLGS